MKKLLAIAAIAALTSMAGTAMADDTADLLVQATVDAACEVTGGTLDFGSLNSLTGGQASGDVDVTVQCTNGTDYTLAGGGGNSGDPTARYMEHETDATQTIAYTLTIPTGGTADGSAQTVNISGTIDEADYQWKKAGNYEDTVVLTVSP